MIVLVLEGARARNEELNAKLRRLTLLTAASTQTLSAKELLDNVLKHVVESVGASHGLVRLLEGEGNQAKLVIHAAVGFRKRICSAIARFQPTKAGPKVFFRRTITLSVSKRKKTNKNAAAWRKARCRKLSPCHCVEKTARSEFWRLAPDRF